MTIIDRIFHCIIANSPLQYHIETDNPKKYKVITRLQSWIACCVRIGRKAPADNDLAT